MSKVVSPKISKGIGKALKKWVTKLLQSKASKEVLANADKSAVEMTEKTIYGFESKAALKGATVESFMVDKKRIAQQYKFFTKEIEEGALQKASKPLAQVNKAKVGIEEALTSGVDEATATAEAFSNIKPITKKYGVDTTKATLKDVNIAIVEHELKSAQRTSINQLATESGTFMNADEIWYQLRKTLKSKKIDVKAKTLMDFVETADSEMLHEASQVMYKNVATNRSIAFGNLKTKYNIPAILSKTGNIRSVTGALYDTLIANDFKNAANKAAKFHHTIAVLESMETKSVRFTNDMAHEVEQYTTNIGKLAHPNNVEFQTKVARAKQDAIVQYIENVDVPQIGMLDAQGKAIIPENWGEIIRPSKGTKGLKITANGDIKLAENLGLNGDDVALANRNINGMRRLRHALNEAQEGTYSFRQSIPNYSEFREGVSRINPANNDMAVITGKPMGDLGHNYFPRIANEKGLERIGKSSRDFMGWKKTRILNQSHGLKPDETISMVESLKEYGNGYKTNVSRDVGRQHLDELAGALTVDYSYKYPTENLKELRDVAMQFRDQIRVVKNGFDAAYQSAPQIKSNALGTIEKSIYAVTDVNTVVALTSPIFAGFNFLQPVTNTSALIEFKHMAKGYVDFFSMVNSSKGAAFKEFRISQSEMGLYKALANGKVMDSSLKALRKSKLDPVVSRAILDYFGNKHPDILQSDVFNMSTPIRNLMSVATFMFKGSDIGARLVAVTSSVHQSKAVLSKFKNIKKNMVSIKQINKELHLEAFDGPDVKRLENMLFKNDINEFISEYASLVTDKTLYNYSRLGKPILMNNAKQHQFVARTTRFLSWNLYYMDYLRGIARAYEAGDKVPAKRLAAVTTAWLTATVAADVATDDDSLLGEIIDYGKKRTPVFTLASIFGTGAGARWGMTGGVIAGIATPTLYTMDKVFSIGGGKSPVDYPLKEAQRTFKAQPIVSKFMSGLEALKLTEEE